ncbi:TSR1, partial [Cordylochernes scorpioides]
FNKEKLFNLESPTDALQLIRHIGQQKMREVKYRDSRPHLLGERIDFEPNSDQTSEGTLKVSGYVRGTTLDVNNPVYLQGLGDFQLSQIEVLQDPHPLSDRKAELGGGILRVERPDPSRQTSLQQDIPDLEMAESVSGEGPECMEEVWATEGMMLAPKTRVRKLPPGTSDYQATWLTDSEGESGDDEEEDDDVSMDEYMAREDSEEDSGDDVSHIADDDTTTFHGCIMVTWCGRRLNKLKDERKEQMYPDEVDLDPSESAQKRFAKYRPLKSFHQSEWDPNEGLPADYSRIVDFRHYRQIRNKVLAEEQEGCEPGSYVTLHIKNVPLAFYELHKEGKPLPVFGLLSYEHRMAMVNLAIEKLPECQASIKSKDRLVFVVGYRRYAACPIFSAHTVGKKYKYERFLPSDKTTMASLYAPVMMTPCPVLVFRDDGCQAEMVAKGSFHSIRSRRIIIKRAVLTGYSYSINKRSVVVRFMFFNREDILAFKSIKLHTRKGCQGEIREPVGTHGMMKCKFERKIASDDVIYMNLYKRVFPKWSYEPTLLAPSTQDCSME